MPCPPHSGRDPPAPGALLASCPHLAWLPPPAPRLRYLPLFGMRCPAMASGSCSTNVTSLAGILATLRRRCLPGRAGQKYFHPVERALETCLQVRESAYVLADERGLVRGFHSEPGVD